MCVEPLTKSAAIKCVASKITSFKTILSSQSCGTTQIFLFENVARLVEYEWLKYVGLVKMMYIKSLIMQPQKIQTLISALKIQI